MPCTDYQTGGEFSVLPTWLLAKGRSSPKDLVGCEQFWLILAQLMQKRNEVPYKPRILGRFEVSATYAGATGADSSVVDVCEYVDVEYVDA